MDATNYFEQNRPVHLARRDVYYERAVEMLLPRPSHEATDPVREFSEILFMLRTSRRHARFAIRAGGRNEKDKEFYRFLDLLVGSVKAVITMLSQKKSVENAEGFFFSFLGVNHASVALQAEEDGRRANDIVRSIHKTLGLAHEPFRQLKDANAAAATEEEAVRYRKAREHFLTLVNSSRSDFADDTVIGLFASDK